MVGHEILDLSIMVRIHARQCWGFMKLIGLIVVLSILSIGCSRVAPQGRHFLLLKDKITRLERKSEVQETVLIKIKKDINGLRKIMQERHDAK